MKKRNNVRSRRVRESRDRRVQSGLKVGKRGEVSMSTRLACPGVSPYISVCACWLVDIGKRGLLAARPASFEMKDPPSQVDYGSPLSDQSQRLLKWHTQIC